MNELINVKNENGELLVSARELHKGLEISERFNSWFDRMLKYGFEEGVDFTSVKSFTVVNNGAKKEIDEYILRIDCAKEICMIQRNEKGRMFRKYFIECEKKLKECQLQLTKKQELQLSILNGNEMERITSLKQYETLVVEEATKPLLNKIEEDAPKVSFAERILKDGDNILVRELAKIATDEGYKIGEKRLYNKLREWGYICSNSTEPTQNAMERDYFLVQTKIINTPYGSKQVFTTLITPKGQVRIVERLLKELRRKND